MMLFAEKISYLPENIVGYLPENLFAGAICWKKLFAGNLSLFENVICFHVYLQE